MATSNIATSRRAVIAALATAPMFAGSIAEAIAAEAQPPSEWWRIKSEYDAALAAEEAFDRDVYQPALEAENEAVAALPHFETASSYANWSDGERIRLRTDNQIHVITTRHFLAQQPGRIANPDDDYSTTARELIDALEQRGLQVRAIHQRLRLDEIDGEYERLADIRRDLEQRLLSTPAPDGEAAAWKLRHLFHDANGSTESWAWEYAGPVINDIARTLTGRV